MNHQLPPDIRILPMNIEDYDELITLWQATEGMGLSPADERRHIARYLKRNPGLSFVARDSEKLVGSVLCGHDGRRGYLQHLAVDRAHRGQGVGRALAEQARLALRREGIHKCHLFVIRTNARAVDFWLHIGWMKRNDIITMSQYTGALEDEKGNRR